MRKELLLSALFTIATVGNACARTEAQANLPVLTAQSREVQPEAGFTRFRSINFPYQIDYPSGWFPLDTTKGGGAIGETINGLQTFDTIIIEPINNRSVTLEDYTKRILTRFFPNQLPQYSEMIKIDGREAIFLYIPARVPTEHDSTLAVFIDRGRGWSITLATHHSVTQRETARFRESLASFRFTG